MAKTDPTLNDEFSGEEELREFPVDRDARFTRVTADDIFVVGRLEDLSFSVMEQGPRPARVRPPLEMEESKKVGRGQVGFEGSYTEVARILISPRAAMAMALQVFEQSLAHGWIEPEDMRETVENMVSRSAADNRKETSL